MDEREAILRTDTTQQTSYLQTLFYIRSKHKTKHGYWDAQTMSSASAMQTPFLYN